MQDVRNLLMDALVPFAIIVGIAISFGLGFFLALRLLGVRRYYPRAEEPTLERMREATSSYLWLGTSAHFVIGYGRIQKLIREKKSRVKIRFVTLDPNCEAVLQEHARWQQITTYDLKERIELSKKAIETLRQVHQCDIAWIGQTQLPTFRVVVIDNKTILVSFYEKGKRGSESRQLELEENSLLGQWFKGYFEKCYWMAKQTEKEAPEDSSLES